MRPRRQRPSRPATASRAAQALSCSRGRTLGLRAGPGSSITVIHFGYAWDSLNSLSCRVDHIDDADRNKLCALHAPEVECIGKGKARKPYEFGVKVWPSRTRAA